MKKNEALCVAYVDEVSTGRDEKQYYSVLVKYDQQLEREVEIYRVKFPGPLKLGEGKPENQNPAIIFNHGDAVQTIDMNKDNYFEEALQMRNLLEEYKYHYGIRKPTILQDHLMAIGFWGKVFEIILDLWFFIFQYGIVYKLGIAARSTSIAIYMLSWVYVFVVFGIYVVVAYTRDTYAAKEHIYYRSVQSLVVVLAILVIVALMEFTEFEFMDIFTSLVAFIPTGWGMILIAQVLGIILQHTIIWHGVVSLARMYAILFGITVMAPAALLSWLPGFQDMQTRILFNEAFSRGLRISQIVRGKNS
ncbi:unnamed protein product [Lupinus luteus]|uniref:Glycosyl transferase 48 domain-containing protein n=1 Tax=Lupinus luteus TaxID=3873 RepID=A0AAV1XLU6_LUPLU